MTPFCLAAYDAEWSKRNKRGMMPNNMIEKIREEDRKKRAQGYPGRIGDIRFTNEGSVRLPSGLRLSGEGPLFLPTLNLNLHHGLVRVKRSQAGLKLFYNCYNSINYASGPLISDQRKVYTLKPFEIA